MSVMSDEGGQQLNTSDAASLTTSISSSFMFLDSQEEFRSKSDSFHKPGEDKRDFDSPEQFNLEELEDEEFSREFCML